MSTWAGPARVLRAWRARDSARGLAEEAPASGSRWGHFGPEAPQCPEGTGQSLENSWWSELQENPRSFLCPNPLPSPAQQPQTPGQCGPWRQKAKEAPQGTKPPPAKPAAEGLGPVDTKLSPRRADSKSFPWPRVLAGAVLGHAPTSLYFTAHPKVRPFDGVWLGQ